MMRRLTAAVFTAVFAFTALPHLALADVTVKVQDGKTESTMYMTADKMAVVSSEGTFQFDSKLDAILIKNGKDVQKMTKKQLQDMSAMASGADMSAMTEQLSAAREQAVAAIKKQGLPAAQEEQMLKMIDKQFPAMPGAKGETKVEKTYKKMGKSKEVSGHKTEGYWVMKGDEKAGEMWVASLSDVGLSKDDFAVMGKFRTFFSEGLGDNPFIGNTLDEFSMFDPNSKDFLGVPLSRTDEKGNVTTVLSIKKGSVDSAVFLK